MNSGDDRGLIPFNAQRPEDDQYSTEDWAQTHPDIVNKWCKVYDACVWHQFNFGVKL
jgi:hypothetical protein